MSDTSSSEAIENEIVAARLEDRGFPKHSDSVPRASSQLNGFITSHPVADHSGVERRNGNRDFEIEYLGSWDRTAV